MLNRFKIIKHKGAKTPEKKEVKTPGQQETKISELFSELKVIEIESCLQENVEVKIILRPKNAEQTKQLALDIYNRTIKDKSSDDEKSFEKLKPLKESKENESLSTLKLIFNRIIAGFSSNECLDKILSDISQEGITAVEEKYLRGSKSMELLKSPFEPSDIEKIKKMICTIFLSNSSNVLIRNLPLAVMPNEINKIIDNIIAEIIRRPKLIIILIKLHDSWVSLKEPKITFALKSEQELQELACNIYKVLVMSFVPKSDEDLQNLIKDLEAIESKTCPNLLKILNVAKSGKEFKTKAEEIRKIALNDQEYQLLNDRAKLRMNQWMDTISFKELPEIKSTDYRKANLLKVYSTAISIDSFGDKREKIVKIKITEEESKLLENTESMKLPEIKDPIDLLDVFDDFLSKVSLQSFDLLKSMQSFDLLKSIILKETEVQNLSKDNISVLFNDIKNIIPSGKLSNALDCLGHCFSLDGGESKCSEKDSKINLIKAPNNIVKFFWVMSYFLSCNIALVLFFGFIHIKILYYHYIFAILLLALTSVVYSFSFGRNKKLIGSPNLGRTFSGEVLKDGANNYNDPLFLYDSFELFFDYFNKIRCNLSSKLKQELDFLLLSSQNSGYSDLSMPSRLARDLGFEGSMSVGWAELFLLLKNVEVWGCKYGGVNSPLKAFFRSCFRKNFFYALKSDGIFNSLFVSSMLNNDSYEKVIAGDKEELVRISSVFEQCRQGRIEGLPPEKIALPDLVEKVLGGAVTCSWAVKKVDGIKNFIGSSCKERKLNSLNISHYNEKLIEYSNFIDGLNFSRWPIVFSFIVAVSGILPIAFVACTTTVFFAILSVLSLAISLNLFCRYKVCSRMACDFKAELSAQRGRLFDEIRCADEALPTARL